MGHPRPHYYGDPPRWPASWVNWADFTAIGSQIRCRILWGSIVWHAI